MSTSIPEQISFKLGFGALLLGHCFNAESFRVGFKLVENVPGNFCSLFLVPALSLDLVEYDQEVSVSAVLHHGLCPLFLQHLVLTTRGDFPPPVRQDQIP